MNEAKPAMPPKNPWPNSSPNKPAPRKPAASPPNNPPPKKPGRARGLTERREGLPGCVIVRWIGAAAVGAVRVGGGAEKVRSAAAAA